MTPNTKKTLAVIVGVVTAVLGVLGSQHVMDPDLVAKITTALGVLFGAGAVTPTKAAPPRSIYGAAILLLLGLGALTQVQAAPLSTPAVADNYRVDFAPIFGQNVCEYVAAVDNDVPVRFAGSMTGVQAPLDNGYGILTDFLVVYFETPAKHFDFYTLNSRAGATMTCWGWSEDPASQVSQYSVWSIPHLVTASGTPANEEWWFDLCLIEARQPITLYYVSVRPYEAK